MPTLEILPQLPAGDMHLGAAPTLVRDELLAIIRASMSDRPRSRQAVIGPSELGTPCLRKLAFKLGQLPPVNAVASWLPEIGTAMHAQLAEVFALWNGEHHDSLGFARYLIETAVNVGQVNGVDISGTADIYDRVTATVIDWKIVGSGSLRRYASGGPVPAYRKQVHLYGAGFIRRGLPVENVAIMFLPRNAELSSALWWSEPYDPDISEATLARATSIDILMSAGTDTERETWLYALPTAPDYCTSCPWFRVLPIATQVTCQGKGFIK